MKKLIIYAVAAFTCVFIAGCGQSAPKGSDQVVKDTVIEIAQGEFRKQLTPVFFQKITKIPVDVIGLNITYDDLKAKAVKDANAKKTVEMVDQAMARSKFSLENIRSNKIDENIKKSYSSADLMINGNKVPIEYSAQLNDDGQVYVEVSGLKF